MCIRDSVRADLFSDAKLRPEANDLDVEVLVDRLELFTQRDEVLMAAQQPPQKRRELEDQRARGIRLRANQRRDRRQRVEEEVWVDLALERFDLCGEQQLCLLL